MGTAKQNAQEETRMKPNISEHELQVQLCSYLKVAGRPGIFWFAVPNGGYRDVRVAAKLKKEGSQRGVPDLVFMLPEGKTAWLEMKIKGGSLSPDQRAFRDCAKALGHNWAVAKSFDEACDFLRSVGVLGEMK
jgi:hypothetical protein